MGTVNVKKSLEALFIGVKFPFDAPSPEIQQMKRMLFSGISVALTPTDIPDGYSKGKDRPEVVVAFFVANGVDNGVDYLSDMRARNRENLTETPGENTFQLGLPCSAMKRIMDALAVDCNVYLIPEEGECVFGRYTLCIITPSLSQ